MAALLKSVRQLLGYLIIGYLLLNTPIGVFFLAQFPLIGRFEYCFRTWLAIDVLLCTILHGTKRRTISGWTGQHMDKYKRYYYQALVIDGLAKLVGDGEHHCKRAFLSEKQQGLV